MNYRNINNEDIADIPEDIASLVPNIANRPEIQAIQERQAKEIRAYAANELDALADAMSYAKNSEELGDSFDAAIDSIISKVRSRANNIRNGK